MVLHAGKNTDVWPFALVLVFLSSLWLLYRRTSWRLPPGPKPIPLVGNVFQTSSGHEWLQYTRWAKEYGPIFYLNFLGERVFVVSSHQVANDILEKNMNAYSDRPRNMVMASNIIGWNRAVALNPGGPQHKKYRKLLSKSLNSTAVRKYRSRQEKSAESLLCNFLNCPEKFFQHIRTTVGQSIVDISYGHGLEIENKDFISYAEHVHEIFALAAKPYAFMIDLIPFLKHVPAWMPGARFQRQAGQWRRDLDLLAQAPFAMVKSELDRGYAPESYVADHLSGGGGTSKPDEDDIMWTAISLYTGGADTTIGGLTAFILLMCLHPKARHKAQKEIEKVVGEQRLPTFEDQPNLKYVTACVKEVLRYWTLAPLGLPHRAMIDEVYSNYDIPAGSTVIANIWGMMHDEAVYSDPFEFKPERFLPFELGGLGEPDCVPTVFGYGRRICPGMHLAEASLWIYAARILAVFDISPVKNEKGEEILPSAEAGPEIISIPKPFSCTITPRSSTAAALILQ